MRAVNLIPRESRRGGAVPSLGSFGPAHLVIGLLVVAVAFVTVYVLTNNTVSQRKAQLASLHQEISQMQAQVNRLDSYEKFEKLAQAREQTVRQIAATRFDWHAALSDLSKVVPSNTSLQTLSATVSPTTSTTGTSSGSGGGVRSDINAPALELKGCSGTQDQVAQLMSRLRLVNGVARVTLLDSAAASQQGGTVSSSPTTGQPGCPAKGPSFDMVVFFGPMAGASSTTGLPSTTPGAAK
jgi:Tfp pilus assembly protein PilN